MRAHGCICYEELQSAIASLDDDAQESVAEKWVATGVRSLASADVEEYLQDLVAHARKAREAGKPLLTLDVALMWPHGVLYNQAL